MKAARFAQNGEGGASYISAIIFEKNGIEMRRSKPGLSDCAPGGLLVSMMGFVGEHPRFGPATPLALLPADLLDSGSLRSYLPGLELLNFVEQQPPGNESIESLLPRCLALHLEAGRAVKQHDAR
jgi:hypothetical protein